MKSISPIYDEDCNKNYCLSIARTAATFRTIQGQYIQNNTSTTTGSNDLNFGNFVYFSITDALEAVPNFDNIYSLCEKMQRSVQNDCAYTRNLSARDT